MQVLKTPCKMEERNVYSILGTMDVDTGKRRVLREFDGAVEAPDSRQITFVSRLKQAV
jgi:hypothetical protein